MDTSCRVIRQYDTTNGLRSNQVFFLETDRQGSIWFNTGYLLHRFDPATPIEETLAALDQLVRQGKVRYLGASSTAAWRLMKALSVSERNGWARFVSMQNHYNLIYREEEREMMPLCVSEGLGPPGP